MSTPVVITSKNEDGNYVLDTGVILKNDGKNIEFESKDIFVGIPEYNYNDALNAINVWEAENV